MERLKCLDCIHFNEDAWLDGNFDQACAADMDIGDPEEVSGCRKGERAEKVLN